MLSPTIAASACAARALGCPGVADRIIAERLSPQRVARMFSLSLTRNRSHACCIVLFAGAIARYRTARGGWDGEDERQLALEALCREPFPDAVVAKLSRKAAALVERHWAEISPAA
jgi:hypothetical protein